MTQQLRALVGPSYVPEPLGKSLTTSTIVWEEATGVRLNDTLKRTHWVVWKGTTGTALFQVGTWLRKLHDASPCGEESVEFTAVIRAVSESLTGRGLGSSPYASMALQPLEAARREIGQKRLLVPRVLSHGDFSLANLVWDKKAGRLFVIDFEDFTPRTLLHDLVSIVSELRVLLLNPLVRKPVILDLEESFWEGYGNISPSTLMFINAAALSRIFYYFLPRLSERRQRRGRLAGATTSVYKAFFETFMISRCLETFLRAGALVDEAPVLTLNCHP